MAMVVDQTIAEHELFGYSTTTTATTTEDEHGYNWNDCSPMVDWDAISIEIRGAKTTIATEIFLLSQFVGSVRVFRTSLPIFGGGPIDLSC
ncbi:hypothetical protein RHGRI_017580 [Rhododendron griersonianum]|uniref:Uncharacterized protein n=1 Tax=Rhododendron griersonianum TaxID=479676 RepID=A0AAV6IGH1_9ERIC|nr:hypothetical protein RHGRI_032809 [Rhododendron griersonianum]KAG5543508.1 hypothetical protein RHGRI_016290 [Rhododendron griersonianum]KAG5545153.1 hypothetical protein RHGRI_017580 [Rhododendron griersonianum]